MSALMAETRPVFVLEIRAADDASPRRARHWLAWVLEADGVSQDTVDTAVLVASELVTNAAIHAGGRVLVSAQLLEAGLRLVVHDDAPAADWQQPGGTTAERGRGLVIVAALAEQFEVDRHAHGVTVTALIPFAGIGVAA